MRSVPDHCRAMTTVSGSSALPETVDRESGPGPTSTPASA